MSQEEHKRNLATFLQEHNGILYHCMLCIACKNYIMLYAINWCSISISLFRNNHKQTSNHDI